VSAGSGVQLASAPGKAPQGMEELCASAPMRTSTRAGLTAATSPQPRRMRQAQQHAAPGVGMVRPRRAHPPLLGRPIVQVVDAVQVQILCVPAGRGWGADACPLLACSWAGAGVARTWGWQRARQRPKGYRHP